ncbi:MAG: glycosyltransferase family 4 protein [Pirellulaceae bacterium]
MKEKTIAIASSGLGHVARGIEAWAHDLGQALAERGLPVIVCKGGGEPQADYERVVRCWTRESPQAKNTLARLPRFLGWRLGMGNGYGVEQATYAWNLIKVLRKERVGLLHVQDPQVALYVQRARRLGWLKTKTILAHGTEEPLDFQRKITYLQHLAPWHLEESRAAGVWKPTWTAIPNFIDTSLFRPGQSPELRRELDIPPNALVVLVAAAIKRNHKRVDYLLDEFAALLQRRPDLPIYLVIAGGWEPETDELVAEGKRRLGDRVRFLVRFPRSRMPDLYRAADLFVLGSLKEMMPIALLEGAASGLPCLVHEHPVMAWMVGPGGKTIDMAASGALACELEQMAGCEGERRNLGSLAQQHCLQNFSREAVVDQILDYYGRVMNTPAKAEASAASEQACV